MTSYLASLKRRTLLRDVPVVAVVGSFGKSTTTRSIIAALGTAAKQFRNRPANSRSGIIEAIVQLRRGDPCAVLELGITTKGQMAPMARTLRPDIAVVTSIGSEHNRSLGTLEETRQEKAEMVRALPPSGFAVLNGDDPNVLWMRGETQANIVTCGTGPENDVRAEHVRLDWPHGMRMLVTIGSEKFEVRTQLIGRQMVFPVLAAIAVARARNCDVHEAATRLAELEPTPGRMHRERLANGAVLICDYHKSAYETILAALDALSEIPAGRRIVILGEVAEPPGKQGPIYREIGKRVAQVATRAVFVGHSVQPYKTGAKRAGMPLSAITTVGDDPVAAAQAVQNELGPGDVVLIKGRDTQRMERAALVLMGRSVGCRVPMCRLKRIACTDCPMLD